MTDEFSYLLAADTYASGRLANPLHPLWPHFESMNILVHPTYASKYPPGQGLILAAGQLLLHSPWAGVCLSVSLMCGGIYWMLEVCVGRRWALTGALLAGLRFGLAGYWMNSYWGGALAAFAGALALGAAIRQRGFLAGFGVVLLAITRPAEGLVFCIPLVFILNRKAWLPAGIVVAAGLSGIAYQNSVVTGDPLRLPYTEHSRQYQAAPSFILSKFRNDIVYLDPFLRLNYAKYEVELISKPFAWLLAVKIWQVWLFFLGPALTVPFLFRPKLLSDRRLRILWPFLALAPATVIVETWCFPHYLAPYTAVFVAFIVQAFRHMNALRTKFGEIVPDVLCVTVVAATFLAVTQHRNDTLSSPPGWCCMETKPWSRFEVLAKLEKEPDPQLLIVRYKLIQPVPAWVYNPADIDSAKVVFARDLGACGNRDLLRYYPKRKKWLLVVDGYEAELSPYPENESCAG